jgi:hypothetical protein
MNELNLGGETPKYTAADVEADRASRINRFVSNHSIEENQSALSIVLRACENYNNLIGDKPLDELD